MNNNRIHDNGINERINDEAWIKEVRRLMAEREVKAPDHLLDAVKQELAAKAQEEPEALLNQPASSSKARLVSLRSYRWAAAAAIVVAIALPLTLLRRGGTPLVPPSIGGLECGRPTVGSTHAVATPSSMASNSPKVSASSSVSTSALSSPYLASNEVSSDTPVTPDAPTPTQHSTLNTSSSNNQGSTETQISFQPQSTPKAQQAPSTMQKRTYNNYHDDNYDYPQPSHQSSHGLSLTAYCGGIGSGSGNGSGMTQGLLMADAEPYGITSVDMLSGTANKNRLVAVDRKKMKAHHNQPIKVGVSVGYALTNRWAVNTGVTYSYLSSDFTADGEPKQTQKLHYVGIPLSASYSVLKGHKAEVYITAGGEVEKLVKGTVSSENSLSTNSNEKVKESRPQFSAKAAVGGAYHFTPSLSIYAEPGVSYYFDNHSSVINVYKDRPTSFSLNVGVRYTVK